MAEETLYEKIEEAETIIKNLCEKYPDVLWAVGASSINVLGISNKEKSKKNKVLAKIKSIKGAERAILRLNNIGVRYVIVVYWSDWNQWNLKQKQWVVLHELIHISYEEGKIIDHDCKDFRIILDAVGVDWFEKQDLPNLLTDTVKFNLNLRPNLDEEGKAEKKEDDFIDDEDDKKPKKEKKEKKAKVEKKEKDEVEYDKTEDDLAEDDPSEEDKEEDQPEDE